MPASAPPPAALPTAPLPTAGQLAWQHDGFGLFLHFGINTFHGREWSDGTLDPATFDPSALDARDWARAAADAEAKYVVLTAKHHDGFCLWPTETTDYSVAAGPWRGGHGDLVAELAEACREFGIGLGLYLSPWDRNAACYQDAAAYDEFYLRQLTELCTGYGPLYELWFDGAGSEGRTYDWQRIMAVVDTHQPDAMVFNMGRPTIRWIGNEDGLATDPCRYEVERNRISIYEHDDRSLGEKRYLPPECDVSIRRHWFWHPHDESLKSTEHLLAVWYRSVGLGAGLLLNVPPDRTGRIDDADRARLAEFTAERRRRFAAPHRTELHPGAAPGEWIARFPHPVALDHLEIREGLTTGQHVNSHSIMAAGRQLAAGGTIGISRLHTFEPLTVSELAIRLDGPQATLDGVAGYLTGHPGVPQLEPQPEFDGRRIDDDHLRAT